MEHWRTLQCCRPTADTTRVAESFEDIWVPRIGQQATRQLRRSSMILLVMGPLTFALATVCSFTFASGTALGVTAGIVAATLAAGMFLYWLQSRIRLARAIHDWIGVPVSWNEMPRMRVEAFDRWKQMKEAGIKPRPGIHRY